MKMDKTEKMLKELTEISGISGYETEIRQLLRKYFTPLGQLSCDKIGSIICQKKGESEKPKIMLAGHMDEIGFMVKSISKEGFLKFTPIGGWWDQVLLSQRVVVKTNQGDVTGVLGAKPPHVLTPEERTKIVEKKDMYIDIGCTSQEEAVKTGVLVGDPVIPVGDFTVMANRKSYLAKAFDNRIGCAMSISLLQKLGKKKHPNSIFAVGTVQEEVGARGAATSVDMVKPDVAIILEVDIAGDVPGIQPENVPAKLGGGPSLLLYDARMIPNLKLRDLVVKIAKKNKIPLQFSTMERGATDGGSIHLYKSGVPTLVIGVPTRHIHSSGSIIFRKDYDQAIKLLEKVILKLDKTMVNSLTDY